METDYSAGDIDVTMAQRQAAEAQESFINFMSIREVAGSADASFGFGTRASRPASGVQGDRYLASDIGTIGGWLYYWTGTAWEILIGWASGTDAVRAAITVSATDNGAWFYASDTAKFWEVSGGAWVDRTPTGTPADAQYVTLATNATLTNERVLTGTANQVTVTDAGAGSTVTLSLPQNIATASTPQFARLGLGQAADGTGLLALTGSGDANKFNLSNTASYVQYAFYESAVKKAAIGYQGSTSSGFLGGAGAMVIGTLTTAPTCLFVNSIVRVTVTSAGVTKIAGTATRATTEGTNHLDIFDGTAPAGTLANGVSIYSTSGECYIMDAAGNATLQSPHNKDGEWIFYSRNTVTGKVLRIDMERLMKALDEKMGGGFVEEFYEDED